MIKQRLIIFYTSFIKIYANFLNIAKQFAFNTALVKSIKYLVNHYLIFQ